MNLMKKWCDGGFVGEFVASVPGRKIVVTRGRPRLVRSKILRLPEVIAEHRVRLESLRAEAERDARACAMPAGPAALYVAKQLRDYPLGASRYTKGDRRRRAKMAGAVVEQPRPPSRRQKRRAAVEQAQIIRERRHESRLATLDRAGALAQDLPETAGVAIYLHLQSLEEDAAKRREAKAQSQGGNSRG
ncbi:MAG: hypothetical protein EKK55_12925 [Rhodocyclaceae bacterium]|nr:MAG: hypothetical protein EKK55_12925 [Rhodocyclaceae bacterium]